MITMKKIFVVFAIFLIANNCLSQNNEAEERIVSAFTGINVNSGINLYLTQGDEHKVIVEAESKYITDVNTRVRNGILYLSLEKMKLRINTSINVYVTVTWIESLDVSAGADVYCNERLKLEKLTVNSSSGADARIDIECRDLILQASSGSDIKAKGSTLNLTAKSSSGSGINAKELESINASLEASSGADIKAKGSALNLTAKSSSGSDINAKELEAINAFLEASSGSDIIAYVLGEIEANASSGSDIVYYGDAIPKLLRQSSGGDIRKRQ